MPSQTIVWLSMAWDSRKVTLLLSPNTCHHVLSKVRCTLYAQRFLPRQWKNLLAFLHCAVLVLLLCQICHHHLTFQDSHLFLIDRRDWLVPLSLSLLPLPDGGWTHPFWPYQFLGGSSFPSSLLRQMPLRFRWGFPVSQGLQPQ